MTGPGPQAVSFDAVGTLLQPAEPVAETYARTAARHGQPVSAQEVADRFPLAFREHVALRGRDPHWKAYWEAVVADAVGSGAPAIVRDLYRYYEQASAWSVVDGTRDTLARLRERGFKLLLISNFDRRLRDLLSDLGLFEAFDAVVISAEVGLEKPDPRIFVLAADRVGVAPEAVLHVGDDRETDVLGARRAGLSAWQIGADLPDLRALPTRLGRKAAARA